MAGAPSDFKMFQRDPWATVSKAALRSMKAMGRKTEISFLFFLYLKHDQR